MNLCAAAGCERDSGRAGRLDPRRCGAGQTALTLWTFLARLGLALVPSIVAILALAGGSAEAISLDDSDLEKLGRPRRGEYLEVNDRRARFSAVTREHRSFIASPPPEPK